MKKLFSMVVACGLAVTLLAGCGSKANTDTPAEKPEVETESEVAADGTKTVKVESEFDDRGWKQVMDVTFDGDKITDVTFDYVNKDGQLKSEDEEYNKNMKEKSGVSAAEAMKQLSEDLVAKQDPEAVDTVSGATSTSEGFKELAKQAIEANK